MAIPKTRSAANADIHPKRGDAYLCGPAAIDATARPLTGRDELRQRRTYPAGCYARVAGPATAAAAALSVIAMATARESQ